MFESNSDSNNSRDVSLYVSKSGKSKKTQHFTHQVNFFIQTQMLLLLELLLELLDVLLLLLLQLLLLYVFIM